MAPKGTNHSILHRLHDRVGALQSQLDRLQNRVDDMGDHDQLKQMASDLKTNVERHKDQFRQIMGHLHYLQTEHLTAMNDKMEKATEQCHRAEEALTKREQSNQSVISQLTLLDNKVTVRFASLDNKFQQLRDSTSMLQELSATLTSTADDKQRYTSLFGDMKLNDIEEEVDELRDGEPEERGLCDGEPKRDSFWLMAAASLKQAVEYKAGEVKDLMRDELRGLIRQVDYAIEAVKATVDDVKERVTCIETFVSNHMESSNPNATLMTLRCKERQRSHSRQSTPRSSSLGTPSKIAGWVRRTSLQRGRSQDCHSKCSLHDHSRSSSESETLRASIKDAQQEAARQAGLVRQAQDALEISQVSGHCCFHV